MTNEQLDAIENRQAAAMWIDGPTAAFAQDTLLLVKALREAHLAEAKALKERDDARAVADQCKDTIAVLREQASAV